MSRSTLVKIASAVGGVVLLAAVIFGVAAISSPSGGQGGLPFIPVGGVPTSTGPAVVPTFTSNASATADSTGSSKTVASSSPQTRTSGSSGSSGYRVTSSSGTGASGNGSGSGTTVTPAAHRLVKPIKEQLPASVAGFSSSGTQLYSTTAIMALQPTPAGRVPMSLALLTVHDFATSARAKAFIEDSIKNIYPDHQQTIPVAGGSVFFGTQGTTFGEVAFYSGRYAYEVTVTSSKGDPFGLKSEAVKLASSYRLP